LQDKECNSGNKDLKKNKGKQIFLGPNDLEKGFEEKKRKEIKANIFEEGKNTKKYNAIKKENE
jgi:hypothetical protein